MTESTTWYTDYVDVVSFAGVLVAAGWLETPGEVVYFFEQPWKWGRVHRAWDAAGRPQPGTSRSWRSYVDQIEAAEADGIGTSHGWSDRRHV